MIIAALEDAFNRAQICGQLRAMIQSGEIIEQSERALEPRCYLKDQPRPIGEPLQIRSAAVTSYFDTSISPPPPKPIAEVRSDRLKDRGPLLDQPRRANQPRGVAGQAEARAKGRLTAIEGKITTCNQVIKNFEQQRAQIVQTGEKRLRGAPDERVREIYADRLAADIRNVDRCLQDARAKLDHQIAMKASIQGGAS
jgi:hypothetical protein